MTFEYLKLILLDECISLHFHSGFLMKALQLAINDQHVSLIEESACSKRAFLQLPTTLQLASCLQFNTSPKSSKRALQLQLPTLQFNTSPGYKVGRFGPSLAVENPVSDKEGLSVTNLHDYPRARLELNKYLLNSFCDFFISVKEFNPKMHHHC